MIAVRTGFAAPSIDAITMMRSPSAVTSYGTPAFWGTSILNSGVGTPAWKAAPEPVTGTLISMRLAAM